MVSAIAVTEEYTIALNANGGKVTFRYEETTEDNMDGYRISLGESYSDRIVIISHYFADKNTRKIYLNNISKNEWELVQ